MEERLFMQYSYDEIFKYIKEIKDAVSAGRYRIEINKKRQKNTELFRDYLISEEKCREILLISFHKQEYPLVYAFK